jgi:hypothetical protein
MSGCLWFNKKKKKIFAAQGLPPVSLTPAANLGGNRFMKKTRSKKSCDTVPLITVGVQYSVLNTAFKISKLSIQKILT